MSITDGYMARRIKPTVLYNNKDISEDITPYLKSISYTDNMGGEADDLQITLEDREGLWSGDWLPDKGAELNCSWTVMNWGSLTSGEQKLNLGIFELDEISCSFNPSEVQIKAVSVPNNTTLRGEEHTRSWEKATLKKIAQDIADGSKMTLVYDSEENPQLDRTEQTSQSDLSFLFKLCSDNGMAVKVTSKQIVIFDEIKYESEKPTITIVKPGTDYTTEDNMTYISNVSSVSFSSKLRDVYKACHVKYRATQKKAYIEATFTDPNKKEGKTLEIKEEVKSVAEAQKLAKRKLREKNSEEVTGSISLLGNFGLLATTVVIILGFGKFDGKYIIKRAQHDVGSGYTCSIDVRRCLNGY